jgi:phosphatidylglycerol---prolipoprotein diacylglyceryl transferase
VHPILFEIPTPWGSFPVYSYGVMLGSSLILAWYIVMWLGEREGFKREVLSNTFMATAVSAIVGARLLYIITNPGEFHSIVDLLALRRGGLVAYGGFLGGLVGAMVYLRIAHGSLLRFADVTAPTLALGLAMTRIGCYLYGCDFGARLSDDAPSWLRELGSFPHWADDTGSPAWSHHVVEYGLDRAADHSFPVHPTQIYESLAGFTMLGLTLLLWRRRTFPGQVLLSLAIAYGLWRFGIEYVRDDPERGAAFGFSTSQLISLAIVPIAAFFYMKARTDQRLHPQPVMRVGAPETYAAIAPATGGIEAGSMAGSEMATEPRASAPKRGGGTVKRSKKKR